jgi:PIN domain nuclease of toxin-antitoxin system
LGIKFIADTHAVLWYLTADARLGANAKAAFENPNNQIIIPAIVVAESLFIIEHGKSPAASSQLWDFILRSTNVTFYPLDLAVLKKSEMLSIIPEMHDRQIIATALALQDAGIETIIVTKDESVRNSDLTKTIW